MTFTIRYNVNENNKFIWNGVPSFSYFALSHELQVVCFLHITCMLDVHIILTSGIRFDARERPNICVMLTGSNWRMRSDRNSLGTPRIGETVFRTVSMTLDNNVPEMCRAANSLLRRLSFTLFLISLWITSGRTFGHFLCEYNVAKYL